MKYKITFVKKESYEVEAENLAKADKIALAIYSGNEKNFNKISIPDQIFIDPIKEGK